MPNIHVEGGSLMVIRKRQNDGMPSPNNHCQSGDDSAFFVEGWKLMILTC